MFKPMRPSLFLVLLSLFSLILASILFFLVTLSQHNLTGDARLLNHVGHIRGSIQYLSKIALVTPETDLNLQYLWLGTEFVTVANDPLVLADTDLYQDFTLSLQELNGQWQALQTQLNQYTESPSPARSASILRLSDECWELANAMVLTIQLAAEQRSQKAQHLVYLIFLIIFICALLVIFFDIYLVRFRLERESARDGLTGLKNKRFFDSTLEYEINRSIRNEKPLTLLLFDIDFFKKVNDQFGHIKGDDVLKELANLVKASIRKSDSVYRVGGEEFAILCPETDLNGAFALAEAVRTKVEHHQFSINSPITISLGISLFDKLMTESKFYVQADKALYRAKNNGRNRTES
jgi:diguanylate cyclase (GGDEF)-like protein